MFNFTVKYFSFLKVIPIVPHVFDTFLKLSYLIYDKKVVDSIDKIELIVSEWENVNVSIHKYGGLQFNVGKREIGHIHSNGLLDILLDQGQKLELVSKGLAEEHHVFKKSGWISFYIKREEDIDKAISLLRISFLKQQKKLELI
jgi:Family of unknown function (DUF5519)